MIFTPLFGYKFVSRIIELTETLSIFWNNINPIPCPDN